MDEYRIEVVAENSILIRYLKPASTELSLAISHCARAIEEEFSQEITQAVASYDALLLTFAPHLPQTFLPGVEKIISSLELKSNHHYGRTITIPTYYDKEVAPHIEEICADTGMALTQLVENHCANPFFVYMIGFCPGFGYMGDLPKAMQLPRRTVPQLKIAEGSVAIADFQTAIYPLAMPGGWHIIGRTPLKIFDAEREEPTLFQQGDRVQFTSISRKQFLELGGTL